MSLHVQLTPDAARVLRQQKRNSTILSLIISLLTIVLFGALLGFLLVKGMTFSPPPTRGVWLPKPETNVNKPPVTNSSITRKPSAPSLSMAPVIVSNSMSPTSIPVPDMVVEIPSADFGNGADLGEGWDTGPDGSSFSPIPASLKKRCSKADRLQRLAESGGNEACEDAVLKSLRWLQKNQNENGSWGREKPVAMTGLALLAYLGHCETTDSPEFGGTVLNGMMYLANNCLKQNGKCATDLQDKHWCYEHAIAVYALSESYTFSKDLAIAAQLKEAVEAGTFWILDNQTEAGGWDYAYASSGRPGDTSIVAWHLQALKAVNATGLRFPKIKNSIRDGLAFLENCQNDNGGFGYGLNKQPVGGADGIFTLTGAGVLCFQQHKGATHSNARKGIAYLAKNSPFDFAARQANLYSHYYDSQAMINHGGDEWREYNGLVRDELLKNQREDGSWPNPGGPGNHTDPVYATTLATLMLEVYYRYLPGTGAKQ